MGVLTLALALCGSPAYATSPGQPYDGSNPFNCKIQNVGTGTNFPDPGADPFCVEFDKTNQNVTDFGLVDFLSQEPARTAAASTKCFYFQRDHWTGSIVQGGQPELYHWDGGYWFDKAKGAGGVSVRNFRIAGQPASAAAFAPPGYGAYFDKNGGGGYETSLDGQVEPDCVAKVDTPTEAAQIYASSQPPESCIPPGGRLNGRRVGSAKLGVTKKNLRTRLGKPRRTARGVDRWCLIGAANLRAGYRHGRVALLRTSSHGHAIKDVAPGDRAKKARKRLGSRLVMRIGKTRVLDGGGKAKRHVFVGVRGGRVRWLAITDPASLRTAKAAKRALRAAR